MTLNKDFSLKDLGRLNYFLGVEVNHTKTGLHLSQSKYINELLHKVNMVEAKGLPTPMVNGLHLSAYNGDTVEDGKLYRSGVGVDLKLVKTSSKTPV